MNISNLKKLETCKICTIYVGALLCYEHEWAVTSLEKLASNTAKDTYYYKIIINIYIIIYIYIYIYIL